jgi:hypothetical protein
MSNGRMVTGLFMIDYCLTLELIKHEAKEKRLWLHNESTESRDSTNTQTTTPITPKRFSFNNN